MTEEEAHHLVESKKNLPFSSLLSHPKKEEIHLHSLVLNYEAFLLVAGKYKADYFRKVIHTISVDQNVIEVVFGDGVFPVKGKGRIKKMLSGKLLKNKIDLPLEEHVAVEEQEQIVLDHHSKETKFPYKINPTTIENYPKRILEECKNVRHPEITNDAAVDMLTKKLKKPIEADVRERNDELTIDEIKQIYVPIYEARLIGPKKKVGIFRIDAVRKNVL